MGERRLIATLFTGTPHLTYCHHVELHLLLHSHILIIHWKQEGAVDGATVCPRVIESDVVNVNSSYLNITVLCPMPVQTCTEIFVEDVGTGVVIMENLKVAKKRGKNMENLVGYMYIFSCNPGKVCCALQCSVSLFL